MSGQPAIVLVHGLSETRNVWWRQVSFLEPSMRVITYDVRGFGSSPAGAADGTVRQMADDLAQLLSAFETGPAWLAGFSMGGVISQRFALDFPDLTKGLVLIASSCAVGRGGREFFKHRIEQVTTGGLKNLATTNDSDARGCFHTGNEELINEYKRLRVGAVRQRKSADRRVGCHSPADARDRRRTRSLLSAESFGDDCRCNTRCRTHGHRRQRPLPAN